MSALEDLPRGAVDAVFDANEFKWDTTRCSPDALRTAGGSELHRRQVITATIEGAGVCVVVAPRITFVSGARLQVVGNRSLVLYAREEFDLPAGAVISVASYNEGSGTDCGDVVVGAGATVPGTHGAGGAGMSSGSGMAIGDGGGGGGGFCGRGGAGGTGGDLTSGAASAGAGGAAAPSMTLVPLRRGSPGGAGGHNFMSDGTPGGPGGGAVQISAPILRMHGTIEAFGASGRGGAGTAAGGGGGSGGAVHLEALRLETDRGVVDVRGGGGGGGGRGGVGGGSCGGREPAPEPQSGGAGGEAGREGGAGAGRARIHGEDGRSGFNAGGGGGGAGCVVVRSLRGDTGIATYPAVSGVVLTQPPSTR